MFTLVSRVTRTLLADPSIASSDAMAAGAAGSGGKDQLADVQRELNAFNTALPPQLRFETVSFRMYAEVGQGAAFALMHVSGAGKGCARTLRMQRMQRLVEGIALRELTHNSYGFIREPRLPSSRRSVQTDEQTIDRSHALAASFTHSSRPSRRSTCRGRERRLCR